jgi:hypothetical protein
MVDGPIALVGAAHKSDMRRGRRTSNCENPMQLRTAVSPRPYSSLSTRHAAHAWLLLVSGLQMPYMCANLCYLSHFIGA